MSGSSTCRGDKPELDQCPGPEVINNLNLAIRAESFDEPVKCVWYKVDGQCKDMSGKATCVGEMPEECPEDKNLLAIKKRSADGP